jgi:aminoglycoside phosphotransferase family enzyme/predicted kinase
MSDGDQTDVIAFLSSPVAHGAAAPVETISSHASIVFLAGERAFKLKRAVKLPYLDFSTVTIREAACRNEHRLNAPAAPELYRGVRRITRRPDGALGFDGDGPLVDTVVEMTRFGQDAILDRVAARGDLTPALQTALAETIAEFHAAAAPAQVASGRQAMADVIALNRRALDLCGAFEAAEIEALDDATRRRLDRHAAMLDQRARAGEVRRCHGDLHLRNICLIGGRPRLYDCLDFSERLATVDTLYDLAFLLMDLWRLDLRREANIIANRYCDLAGEIEGFCLLAFFMAARATVRAHVEATMARTGQPERLKEARRYFALAGELLDAAAPRLIALGGFSGSGKTTVAEALAFRLHPAPGARILETDRIRKAMHGVPALRALPQEAYAPGVSQAVYQAQADQAAALTRAGASVVAGAVFDREETRLAIAAAAGGAEFTGVWLTASATTLADRIASRPASASDATAAVLDQQMRKPPGEMTWAAVDVSAGDPAQTVRDVRRLAGV